MTALGFGGIMLGRFRLFGSKLVFKARLRATSFGAAWFASTRFCFAMKCIACKSMSIQAGGGFTPKGNLAPKEGDAGIVLRKFNFGDETVAVLATKVDANVTGICWLFLIVALVNLPDKQGVIKLCFGERKLELLAKTLKDSFTRMFAALFGHLEIGIFLLASFGALLRLALS